MRTPATLASLAIVAGALAGCAGTASDRADDAIEVVASTNVYGQIVAEIGGDRVNVTSIISSAAQDPHSYEPSTRDKLAVNRADLIVANGGGYDSFIAGLRVDDSAPLIEAVEFAPDYEGATHTHDHAGNAERDHAHDQHEADAHEPHDDASEAHAHDEADHHGHTHIAGFNEHVWYDPEIMAALAHDIAAHLAELDPAHAAEFTDRAQAFETELATLIATIDDLNAQYRDHDILVTEPVSLRLTDRIGLHNLTPDAFLEAVEEGQDVAPATLLATLKVVQQGDVAVVIANTQTGGVETQRVIDDATAQNIPVIEYAEIMPRDTTYVQFMRANLAALSAALEGSQ